MQTEVLAWSFTSRKAAVSTLQSQAAWVVQQLQSLLDGCSGQHQQLLANTSEVLAASNVIFPALLKLLSFQTYYDRVLKNLYAACSTAPSSKALQWAKSRA